MKKSNRKKLFIIAPVCLLLLACIIALSVYYTSEGWGGMISLFASVNCTNRMQAKEYKDQNGAVLPYRIYVPENYDAAEQYPLVLYLHGSGERGNDNRAQAKKNSVMQTLLNPENLSKYPCIVLAPQCPEGQWWAENSPDEAMPDNRKLLMGLLEQTKSAYSINAARIYITGVSMGGYGTWGMLAAYPDYFAAAIPICGGWEAEEAPLFKDVPIWAFHGSKDKAVPAQNSRGMVKALRDAGSEVKYTEYPKERHPCWELAYREADLFSWMFAQNNQE